MKRLLIILAMTLAILLPTGASAAIPTNWTNTYMTWYESYPTSQEECENYGGCQWAGYFAFVNGKQTPAWVKSHKIAAVYDKLSAPYRRQWLEVRIWDSRARKYNYGKVQVLDVASDADCHDCGITPGQLVKKYGFLLDLEVYTMRGITGGKLFTGVAQYRRTTAP